MNAWKILAILFAIFSLGAMKETYRILVSEDANIVANRFSLIPMTIIVTGLFIYLTLFFWNKSKK